MTGFLAVATQQGLVADAQSIGTVNLRALNLDLLTERHRTWDSAVNKPRGEPA
ncbi:hypothetical protein [Streptomyces sp. NPDC048496]|uniref:hypothetical protein n=1 Tax=Streptomyces sp. NPDC048496 TaxID=3365558 RepID=UPI003716BD16